jgi:asparagine synthase (glutamine-hydrolysing)
MCGIAGILNFQPDHQNLETQINRMQAALQHRGPDDTGIYIAPYQQAALAHTRLSIIDLRSAGHQPMSTPDNRYHITFNGEISEMLNVVTKLYIVRYSSPIKGENVNIS